MAQASDSPQSLPQGDAWFSSLPFIDDGCGLLDDAWRAGEEPVNDGSSMSCKNVDSSDDAGPSASASWGLGGSAGPQGEKKGKKRTRDASQADGHVNMEDSPTMTSDKDATSGGKSKACKEKLRRDRLNDKFTELSAALAPYAPIRTDKGTILTDALRVIKQLQDEVTSLRESNNRLMENNKELKQEKSELRDEKAFLRTEKARLERQLEMTLAKAASMAAAAAAAQSDSVAAGADGVNAAKAAAAPATADGAAAPTAAVARKLGHQLVTQNYADLLAMPWQWLPPSALDTSKDHILRPPVA